jgi:hypothetical protein
MSDINRSTVLVDLKDLKGRTLNDTVRLKFYNQRAQSLNQSFELELKQSAFLQQMSGCSRFQPKSESPPVAVLIGEDLTSPIFNQLYLSLLKTSPAHL